MTKPATIAPPDELSSVADMMMMMVLVLLVVVVNDAVAFVNLENVVGSTTWETGRKSSSSMVVDVICRGR
jgi:hypothetical protein